MKTKRVKVSCDRCQMLSINGVACHEIGCRNMGARWDMDSETWVKQRTCFTCGYKVDSDAHCCCDCWDCNTELEGDRA